MISALNRSHNSKSLIHNNKYANLLAYSNFTENSQSKNMKKAYLILLFLLPLSAFCQEIITVNEEKKTSLEGFKMFPNPVYGDEVYISSSTNGKKDIKIFDVFGDIVLADRLNTNTLNVAKLSPGVYVLQATENKKHTRRKLVIK